jgi:hypothetical protein
MFRARDTLERRQLQRFAFAIFRSCGEQAEVRAVS